MQLLHLILDFSSKIEKFSIFYICPLSLLNIRTRSTGKPVPFSIADVRTRAGERWRYAKTRANFSRSSSRHVKQVIRVRDARTRFPPTCLCVGTCARLLGLLVRAGDGERNSGKKGKKEREREKRRAAKDLRRGKGERERKAEQMSTVNPARVSVSRPVNFSHMTKSVYIFLIMLLSRVRQSIEFPRNPERIFAKSAVNSNARTVFVRYLRNSSPFALTVLSTREKRETDTYELKH